MAKTNMIERDKRRVLAAKKYAVVRASLKEKIRSPKTSAEDRQAAQAKLQALPRDASPTRQRNRCAITGRSRVCTASSGWRAPRFARSPRAARFPGLPRRAGRSHNDEHD